MLRTAERYLLEEMGIEMPKDHISGSWFEENDLPMIVTCSCCGSTLALPAALIDDSGAICCSYCVDE